MRTLFRLVTITSLMATIAAGTTGAVGAADTTRGAVGPYKVFDGRGDPSTLCAYPATGSRLQSFRIRGPRVDFPDRVGPVGWVEWQLLTQRRDPAGEWQTVARTDPRRRTVTVGFSATFPTLDVPVTDQTGQGRLRLVTKLSWFDQGDARVGAARHAVRHYGRVRFGPGDGRPVSFESVERRDLGSCPNRWAA